MRTSKLQAHQDRSESETTMAPTPCHTPEAIFSVLHESRDALLSLLTVIGIDPSQTRATAEKLGLDRTFVWRLRRVFSSPDLLTAAMDFPDRSRVEKICNACLAAGAPEASAECLRRASARLEDLVTRSSGDWETFTAMLSGLEYGDVTERQEEARRQVFHGARSIWAAQAQALLKTGIIDVNPDDPDQLDIVRIEGMVNFRRLRAISWPLYRTFIHDDDDAPVPVVSEAVDPESMRRHGMPLLEPFCTQPLPAFRCRLSDAGKCYELEPGSIGNASAMDFFFGDFFPKVHPRYRDHGEDHIGARLSITTPVEVGICDLFLHQDVVMDGPPEVLLFDKLNASETDTIQTHVMPLSTKPLLLGPGAGGCAVPQVPRYPEILAYVFEKAGKELGDFLGYRFMLTYPTVATMLNIRYRLAAR